MRGMINFQDPRLFWFRFRILPKVLWPKTRQTLPKINKKCIFLHKMPFFFYFAPQRASKIPEKSQPLRKKPQLFSVLNIGIFSFSRAMSAFMDLDPIHVLNWITAMRMIGQSHRYTWHGVPLLESTLRWLWARWKEGLEKRRCPWNKAKSSKTFYQFRGFPVASVVENLCLPFQRYCKEEKVGTVVS